MRLLDRYLLRESLIPLGYCLSGFLIFWIGFDLFTELSDFHEEGLGGREIFSYYLYQLPEILTLILPVALLLALLYALTNHARYHELTAMRAAGQSLMRLAVPYLGLGLLCSGILLMNEWLFAGAPQAAEELRQRYEDRASGREPGWVMSLNFRNARDGRVWSIGGYHLETGAMRNPQVSWLLEDQSRRSLIAQQAVRSNGVWIFYEVQELIYEPRLTNYTTTNWAVLPVPEFSETPEQIKSEIKVSQLTSLKASRDVQLSVQEILNYLRLHPDLKPSDRAMFLTQLHAGLARPWTCLVVVLIAIPFGAQSGRRNVFVGVASSIFICFAYFILLRVGLALGTGGYLPPWLAAWTPNLLFAGAGLWLMGRVR